MSLAAILSDLSTYAAIGRVAMARAWEYAPTYQGGPCELCGGEIDADGCTSGCDLEAPCCSYCLQVQERHGDYVPTLVLSETGEWVCRSCRAQERRGEELEFARGCLSCRAVVHTQDGYCGGCW